MRGFALSLAAVALTLTLLLFFSGLNNNFQDMERSTEKSRPLTYAAMATSSIGYEISEIAGPEIEIRNGNETLVIEVAESLPLSGMAGRLSSYLYYVETNFSQAAHAEISVNASNMTDGKLETVLMDNYLCENNYSGGNALLFGTLDGNASTGATAYRINISVNRNRSSLDSFPFGAGDINVTLTYIDLNGTVVESGMLQSGAINTFRISYAAATMESLNITVGRIANRTGAVLLEYGNTTVSFSMEAVLPLHNASMPAGYRYEASITYRQAEVNKTCYAGR